MALKFKCNHCEKEIISKFLKVGDISHCKNCDTKIKIPKSAILFEIEEPKKDVLTQSVEQKSIITLSEKYNVLELYKGLAYLMMIAATGFFIYAVAQFGDAPKAMRKMLENTMITSTVSYVITMFSLFCLTKIIDFLFDLDKQDKILVSDKNFTE
jgi:hypothetical protein